MSDERLGGGSPNSSWRSRAEWLAGRAEVQVEQPVADQAGQRLELFREHLLSMRALLARAQPTRTQTRAPEKTGPARAAVPEEQAALQVQGIPEHS